MDLVVSGAKTRMHKRAGSGVQEMLLLITDAPSTGIDLFKKFPIVAVELFGIDTNNWT